MGSMIICGRETEWGALRRGGRARAGGLGTGLRAPAHLSIVFEIFVCPTQLLYENRI